MKVYLFKPRFAPMVEAGTKRQTIRPKRKHPTKVGDELSLRTWTGKPYRSKQRILRQGERCKEVHSFELRAIQESNFLRLQCFLDGVRQETWITGNGDWDKLAHADGFASAGEMIDWFGKEHGFPFEGELIKW